MKWILPGSGFNKFTWNIFWKYALNQTWDHATYYLEIHHRNLCCHYQNYIYWIVRQRKTHRLWKSLTTKDQRLILVYSIYYISSVKWNGLAHPLLLAPQALVISRSELIMGQTQSILHYSCFNIVSLLLFQYWHTHLRPLFLSKKIGL